MRATYPSVIGQVAGPFFGTATSPCPILSQVPRSLGPEPYNAWPTPQDLKISSRTPPSAASCLLRQGTVLVDERDSGVEPRGLFCLEHPIQDASRPAPASRESSPSACSTLSSTRPGRPAICTTRPVLIIGRGRSAGPRSTPSSVTRSAPGSPVSWSTLRRPTLSRTWCPSTSMRSGPAELELVAKTDVAPARLPHERSACEGYGQGHSMRATSAGRASSACSTSWSRDVLRRLLLTP